MGCRSPPARQCQLNWQEGLHAGTAPKAPSERRTQVADSPPIPAGVTLIFISTSYRVNRVDINRDYFEKSAEINPDFRIYTFCRKFDSTHWIFPSADCTCHH